MGNNAKYNSKDIDKKLRELHRERTKMMRDDELLQPLIRPVEWDSSFLVAVKEEINQRHKN